MARLKTPDDKAESCIRNPGFIDRFTVCALFTVRTVVTSAHLYVVLSGYKRAIYVATVKDRTGETQVTMDPFEKHGLDDDAFGDKSILRTFDAFRMYPIRVLDHV